MRFGNGAAMACDGRGACSLQTGSCCCVLSAFKGAKRKSLGVANPQAVASHCLSEGVFFCTLLVESLRLVAPADVGSHRRLGQVLHSIWGAVAKHGGGCGESSCSERQ